jgi:hypothetical protein
MVVKEANGNEGDREKKRKKKVKIQNWKNGA